MPCWELFDQQSDSYRAEILGDAGVRVAVEAAACFGWARYGVDESKVIGMRSFGASAPAAEVYAQIKRWCEQGRSQAATPGESDG